MRMGRNWKLHKLLTRLQTGLTALKRVWHFFNYRDMQLSYDPEILLPVKHTREMETYVHTKTCAQIFIALFTTVTK